MPHGLPVPQRRRDPAPGGAPGKLDADLGYLIQLGSEKTRKTGYRFEDYDVTNFRDQNIPPTLVDADGNLYLGDTVGDYTAHIFGVSAVVNF